MTANHQFNLINYHLLQEYNQRLHERAATAVLLAQYTHKIYRIAVNFRTFSLPYY